MRRLLLVLVPLVLAAPAVAFDGGGFDAAEKTDVSRKQSETTTLAKYSEFHASCMEIQLTMWGEVAQLKEELATAHCYCEYSKLKGLSSITWEDEEAAYTACAREGSTRKKEAFMWWALPLHRQKLKNEQ
ncbi:MAG: hypothetical protein ACJ0GM_04170 [Parasynechococcus sp.]|uniref:hypothetical protein n=1 Tax=Synechococcus sp. BL107 TaxID=313625 RepID=UPI001E32F87B|nr:hypothetical protein [Synechococcus sp. BL107]